MRTSSKNHIYAVILGSALGGDGNKKIGFTAPSVEGERKTILKAWETAAITAEDIDYVEAHGTATMLGDEIEAEALGQAAAGRSKPLLIGSAKSNVGHLNIAAGVAGFIKTSLMLDNNCIFPTMFDINIFACIFYPPKTPCFHCLFDHEKLINLKEMEELLKRNSRDEQYL